MSQMRGAAAAAPLQPPPSVSKEGEACLAATNSKGFRRGDACVALQPPPCVEKEGEASLAATNSKGFRRGDACVALQPPPCVSKEGEACLAATNSKGFRRGDACVALNRYGVACSPVMSRIASRAVPCEEMGRESRSQGGNRYAEIPDTREIPASTRLARRSACWIVTVAADERGRYGAARNAIDRALSGGPQHSVDRHHGHRRADPVPVRRARSDHRGGDHAAARATNGMAHSPRSADSGGACLH